MPPLLRVRLLTKQWKTNYHSIDWYLIDLNLIPIIIVRSNNHWWCIVVDTHLLAQLCSPFGLVQVNALLAVRFFVHFENLITVYCLLENILSIEVLEVSNSIRRSCVQLQRALALTLIHLPSDQQWLFTFPPLIALEKLNRSPKRP